MGPRGFDMVVSLRRVPSEEKVPHKGGGRGFHMQGKFLRQIPNRGKPSSRKRVHQRFHRQKSVFLRGRSVGSLGGSVTYVKGTYLKRRFAKKEEDENRSFTTEESRLGPHQEVTSYLGAAVLKKSWLGRGGPGEKVNPGEWKGFRLRLGRTPPFPDLPLAQHCGFPKFSQRDPPNARPSFSKKPFHRKTCQVTSAKVMEYLLKAVRGRMDTQV